MALVEHAHNDGVSRITLVDADRGNPINLDTTGQLLVAVRAAAEADARVIVLASTGRFFSVGGDLAAFGEVENLAAYVDDLADLLHRVVSELQRSDAVVVAAVQGVSAGAGFPLVAAADLVIASDKAKFTLGYTRVGLSVDGGATQMVHTLGLHRTLRLALLNDVLTAQEAHAAGLVARVVPSEDLAGTVDEIVSVLSAGAPASYAVTKRLVREAAETYPEGRLRQEALAVRELASGPDAAEGIAAFLAKRPPVFGR